MNYTWEITNIKTAPELNGHSNVIVHVRWKKIGTDENGFTGEFQGATPFSVPENSTFTPYEDLTKEQVLGWIQTVVVGAYEEHVNSQIQKQIIKKNDPWSDISVAPWGQSFEHATQSGSITPP